MIENPNISTGAGLAWLGFWLFLAVFLLVEAWLYNQGHDTLLYEHKTDQEKRIQELKIEQLREKGES